MRLHLGCGKKILPGYVNIDATCGDKVMDIRDLSIYADNSVEEILAVHVFEHFWLKDIESILKEWKRVLKPSGELILEMPCCDKVFAYIVQQVFSRLPINENMSLWAMYGEPSTVRTEQDLHKWLWSMSSIESVLKLSGFASIKFEEPMFHVKTRDMRVKAVK